MADKDITQTVKEVLERMSVPAERVEVKDAGTYTRINTTISGDIDVVGPDGVYIKALEHIVERILEAREIDTPRFRLDINAFYEKKAEEIKNRARLLAERARMFRYDVELPPMNSYERLLVHDALSDEHGVATQSYGVGKLRRVVIRFIGGGEEENDSLSETTHKGAKESLR